MQKPDLKRFVMLQQTTQTSFLRIFFSRGSRSAWQASEKQGAHLPAAVAYDLFFKFADFVIEAKSASRSMRQDKLERF
ncbi:hypothetical protein L0337_42240 [candidate division KSB1 bacterium]|nr:hypothetical protein [candidate division KSB1 bacterium]